MISIKFEGGAELAKALDELSVRLGRKVMREVLTEAAEPIRARGESLAPLGKIAPHQKPSVTISIPKKSAYLDLSREIATVAIGPSHDFPEALPVELGTVDTSAQPYMRPAFDAEHGKALQIVSDAAWRELAGRGIQRPMASVDTPLDGEA